MKTRNNIVSGQPFGNLLDDLFNRSISDIVGTDFTHETPNVNIIEKDDSFELDIAAPGLTKKDFKITVEKDYLIVSADNKEETTEKDSTPNFKRKEYNFQRFSRKFKLPKTVDNDSISAKYKLGILKITINKMEEVKEKEAFSIEIK